MSTATADDGSAPDAPARPRPGMAKFYVAGLVLVGLAVGGAWFWITWQNWQFGAAEAARRQRAAAEQFGVPVETAVDLPPSPSSAKASEGSGAARGGGVKIDLVLIPPGMFDMGSPVDEAGRYENESPVHRVRIGRPFYMGKYEVTQEQWERVMGSNPSHFKGPKHPVEQVSWDDCQQFLEKLNALGKMKGRFRLPTEAEWEWACRAGTKTRFSFGDADADLTDHAWHAANSGSTTHPVGEKQPNAWGLHDCHGNVWEWCADSWGNYSPNPWPGVFRWQTDPQGPASGPGRVLRGGGWGSSPGLCRSAYRLYYGPSVRNHYVGLRVAVVVAVPSTARVRRPAWRPPERAGRGPRETSCAAPGKLSGRPNSAGPAAGW